MVLHSLTDKTYTAWGMRYSYINWRPEWYTFIRIQSREIKESFKHKDYNVKHIIAWFDSQILQRMSIDSGATMDVRIRIICGFINKSRSLTREQKIEFMECIWDTYRKFKYEWTEYYYKYILELPF